MREGKYEAHAITNTTTGRHNGGGNRRVGSPTHLLVIQGFVPLVVVWQRGLLREPFQRRVADLFRHLAELRHAAALVNGRF